MDHYHRRVTAVEGAEHSQVGQDILLSDRHSGGSTGRTGGVLKEGDLLTRRGFPNISFRLKLCQDSRVQSEGGLAVFGEPLQTAERALPAVFLDRWGGHGDRSGVDTAPESSDKVKAGAEGQKDPVAGLESTVSQGCGQTLCRREEPAVAQTLDDLVAGADESEASGGVLLGGALEKLEESQPFNPSRPRSRASS